jgi:hypothetical protein
MCFTKVCGFFQEVETGFVSSPLGGEGEGEGDEWFNRRRSFLVTPHCPFPRSSRGFDRKLPIGVSRQLFDFSTL